MNNSMVRRCDKTVEWALIISFPAIALAQSTLSYTSILIKTTLLQCAAAVAFGAWVVRSLEQRRILLEKPQVRLMAPAFAFMLSALVNFIFITPSKDTSIDELLLRVPYFLIFFLTLVTFVDGQRIRKAFGAIVGTSFAVSLYGVLQHFGWDPFGVGFSRERISSFFGNPNVYAGFLTLAIPAVAGAFGFSDDRGRKIAMVNIGIVLVSALVYRCVMLFFQSLLVQGIVIVACGAAVTIAVLFRDRSKTGAALALFLLLINVFLTGSRSALIGLGAAAIVFAVLASVFTRRSASRRIAVVVGALSIACAGLVTIGVLRITRSDEGRRNTVSQRRYYVSAALELLRQRPLLGHGIGTFKNNYPLVKPKASWAFNEACFEHVSNVYNEHLEVLHDEGATGFLVYLWFIVAVLLTALRALQADRGMPGSGDTAGGHGSAGMVIGIVSGVTALLVGNAFSLSMRYASTGFAYWFFTGLLAAQALTLRKSGSPSEAAHRDSSQAVSARACRLSGKPPAWVRPSQAAVALAAVAATVFSFRLYWADFILNEAVGHSKDAYRAVENTDNVYHDIFVDGTYYRSDSTEWEKAIADYRRSIACNSFNLRARYFLGNAFNRRWDMRPTCKAAWGDTAGRPRTDADRAMEHYDRIVRQAPHFVEIDFELGDLFSKIGDFDSALFHYNEYKKYKPFFTKIHYALAGVYAAKRDWQRAVEAYKDALDLNERFTKGYIDLSVAYHYIGKDDLSEESYKKARELSPDRADMAMARAWSDRGEGDRALDCYLRRIASDSADADAHCGAGWCYVRKQEWPNAIFHYRKAASSNPPNVSALVNLSNLYYQTGNLDASREAYIKAMNIDPVYVRSVAAGNTPQDVRNDRRRGEADRHSKPE
ncbi:MAG: O-antigen ligase family protein [Chitinispirillaceae bacterium]|nr:O-antigen ligase family protein [Chitinispirillaceae bacterium]